MKIKYDEPVSNVGFKCSMRHYTGVSLYMLIEMVFGTLLVWLGMGEVGQCRFTPT